jgi:hypothetical protein
MRGLRTEGNFQVYSISRMFLNNPPRLRSQIASLCPWLVVQKGPARQSTLEIEDRGDCRALIKDRV